jgi:hypothetical protein
MKPRSEKALARRKAQNIGLAVAVLMASTRVVAAQEQPRTMDFTKTYLLAPRSMTAIARPMINQERLAGWV